jgi:hypothetical protein
LLDFVVAEIISQWFGNEGVTIVRQQSRTQLDLDDPGSLQSDIQSLFHIGAGHGGCQAIGQNATREVVEHRTQVMPAPTYHLELSRISLPHLIDATDLVLEFITGCDQLKDRTGHRVKGSEDKTGTFTFR